MTGYTNSSALWHPFSKPIGDVAARLRVVGGHGAHLQDEDGKIYLDSISGLWNVPLGYSCFEVGEAVRTQLDRLPGHSLIVGTTDIAEEVAALLVNLCGVDSISSAFLTNGGAESIETAIKLARHYFQVAGDKRRTEIVSFKDAYHGLTYGALTISGFDEDKATAGALIGDVFHAASPRQIVEGKGDASAYLKAFDELLDSRGVENIAAVVVEPVAAVAGMIELPPAVLQHIAKRCADGGILLIVDEVTSGVGRGSRLLFSEKARIRPDMVVLSKALTNGYLPFGAVLISKPICDACESSSAGAFAHGYTFGGNPLACAAAKAALTTLDANYFGEPLTAMTTKLGSILTEELTNRNGIVGWRQAGLLAAVEIDCPSGTDPSIHARRVRLRARELGLIVRATRGYRTFNFAPMYVTSDEDLRLTFAVFASAVSESMDVH